MFLCFIVKYAGEKEIHTASPAKSTCPETGQKVVSEPDNLKLYFELNTCKLQYTSKL